LANPIRANAGRRINIDLAVEPFFQNFTALIVQRPPCHVDRFDLRRGGKPDGLIIAFANLEIVFDDHPERRHGKADD
jgi:hypothetical protein